jgi:hypothetical protein
VPIVDLDALPAVDARVVAVGGPCAAAGACGGGWFVVARDGATIAVRDADGRSVVEWPLPRGFAGAPRVALSSEASWAAVAGEREVWMVELASGQVRTVAHPSWKGRSGGDVAFDPNDAGGPRVWAVWPRERASGLLRQPPTGVLARIDARSGAVLEEHDLHDDHPEGYFLHAVPGRGVVVHGMYGQDGSTVWYARSRGGDVGEVRSAGFTGIVSSIDPTSGEVLVTPHDDMDVEVRTWWDHELVGGAPGEELFGTWDEQEDLLDTVEGPDGFDNAAGFVDAERIVVATQSERFLVLDRSTGTPLGRLRVGGADPFAHWVHQLAPGRLLLVDPSGPSVVDVG